MANIDTILKSVEDQSKALAEKLFKQYTHQAVSDVRDFLQKSTLNLKRWVEELVRGDLDKDEFESLIKGQADVAERRARVSRDQGRLDVCRSQPALCLLQRARDRRDGAAGQRRISSRRNQIARQTGRLSGKGMALPHSRFHQETDREMLFRRQETSDHFLSSHQRGRRN